MATLSQLLADPTLGLRLIQSAPEDPVLTWASTTELLHLAQYLQGGEIVLTTGLSLEADDPRWRDFVAGLSRARVAAIGFGIGVNHAGIPRPLVAAASDYRVALVEVPPPTPFVAVSKAVSGLLHADEIRAANRALQAHQRLLEGARGSADAASVLSSIALVTGRQLALQLTGTSSDQSGTHRRIAASTAGFTATHDADPEGTDSVLIDEATGAKLLVASGPALTPEAGAVVAAGAMVLGMGLRAERVGLEREQDRWSRLTMALLGDELSVEAAQVLDPALRLPEEARAIALQGASENVAAWRRDPREGVDRLVTVGSPQRDGVSLAWQLCPADEHAIESALDHAAKHDLDAVVGRTATPGLLRTSFNSAASLLGSLSRSAPLYTSPRVPAVLRAERATPLLEALIAADAGAGVSSGAGRGAANGTSAGVIAETGTSTASTSTTSASARPLGLAASVLGPLAAAGVILADDERNMLRETLRTLLEHHGQRTPTAAALSIHRNTLRDRLRRIEQLTGRSFESPDARAELWLALRLEEQLTSFGGSSISKRPSRNATTSSVLNTGAESSAPRG